MTQKHLQTLLQFDYQGNGIYAPDHEYGPEYKYLFDEGYLDQFQDETGGFKHTYWKITQKGKDVVYSVMSTAMNVR